MPKLKMKTDSEKTELALCSISVGWLVHGLFEKYAPSFADGVDWKKFLKLGREERKVFAVATKNELKDKYAAFHKDLCGALNLIAFIANSRKIGKHMAHVVKSRGISSRFGEDCLRRKLVDGEMSEPFNKAAWFCVREEAFPKEWDALKRLALAEEQRYYNWTWYAIAEPTKFDEAREAGCGDLEEALKKVFSEKKDDKNFPVKVIQLGAEKMFMRYCVSTAKDPVETFLAQNGVIARGNDPTANTFLIDHYWSCNYIRVTFPGVIDSDEVAELFANHVLGCDTTREEPRVYLNTMRQYATRSDCESAFEKVRAECKNVKDIRLKAIRFTVAEDIKKAELRRLAAENKKRKREKLPQLPRLKCEVFENGRLFDEMERCFTEKARTKELLDVFELVFAIDLYADTDKPCLPAMRDAASTVKTYKLHVTAKKVNFVPRIMEVSNDIHREALKKVQSLLNFAPELAVDVLAKEKDA